MLRKNEGSVLIITLMIFSIVSLICMTCVSLVYSNIKVSNLELKNLQLKESSLGAIDIVYSNMKKEVNYIIDESSNKEEFISCFRKDNFKSFIIKSKDISHSNLKNVEIEMVNKTNFGEIEKLKFAIKAISRDDAYKKEVKFNIEILNPWMSIESRLEEENDTEEDAVNIEDIKEELKKLKLINMYDYEEL
ncbi:MAG: hypothetical protein ACRDD7_08145 [Peptostreptococcaceae bacterium]